MIVFLSIFGGALSFQSAYVSPLIGRKIFSCSKVRRFNTFRSEDVESSIIVPASASWEVDDNWWRLSDAQSATSLPEPGEDIVKTAALSMEHPSNEELSEDDEWVNDSVNVILDSALDSDTSLGPIYDAPGEKMQVTLEDQMGKEIALLVRCNQSPQEMLVSEGRALPPLTDEERNDFSQLVTKGNDTIEFTDFFRYSISAMFKEHANPDGVMKAAGVASWMSRSLGTHVSAHDRRVLATITSFGEYGTGSLTAGDFEEVYRVAVTKAMNRPHVAEKNRAGIKEQHSIETIWRDIRNHHILSPVEVKREMELLEIRKKLEDLPKIERLGTLEIMDECEILDAGQSFATTTYQTSWDDVKDKEFTSHELLEMAADGKTPLFLRDGDFIFIDEESCIGCTQCVTTAPSSFLMLDHGRARTFEQRNDPDVTAAVTTCPVSCMHRVSFDELKQLEIARERGDGRTDHKHCGSSSGYTPLHVARRGTDANKKDSWYHFLKQKCFCTSPRMKYAIAGLSMTSN